MEKSIAVVIGRFEPIHKGHEKIINIGIKNSDITLVLIIDNCNCIIPIELRIKLINEIYKEQINKKKLIIKKFIPNKHVNHKYGENIISSVKQILGRKPNYIIFGSDKKIENCFDKKYINDINFIKVDRNRFNVSGTRLRCAIKNNDKYYVRHAFNKKLFKYISKIDKFC